MSIILSGTKGTLNACVCYSKTFVFSFIDVLLDFLKNLRIFLFPLIVISAFIGFDLQLCKDFSCIMTGSSFGIFVVILVLIFL